MSEAARQARGTGASRPLAFSRRARRALLLAPLIVLLASLPGHAAADGVPYLVLTTRAGEVLVDAPLPPSRAWSIEWTHSVAQVLIIDVFAWRNETLYVTDQFTPYLDIAGLGDFVGGGVLHQLPDGGYHLANIDLPLHGNAHDLIIGSRRAPSVLVVGERRFALSETHPASHARIEVQLR